MDNAIELIIGDIKLKSGSFFRIGKNRYKVIFSPAGHVHNIDLWDFQKTKPLSVIGSIKKDGSANYHGILDRIEEVFD